MREGEGRMRGNKRERWREKKEYRDRMCKRGDDKEEKKEYKRRETKRQR